MPDDRQSPMPQSGRQAVPLPRRRALEEDSRTTGEARAHGADGTRATTGAPPGDSEPDSGHPAAEASVWRRLLHDLLRPSRGQLLVAVVLAVVSAAVVVQVRAKRTDDTYSTMRRTDLVQLLDQLNGEQGRLNGELSRLEQTRAKLASGADARRVAAAENAKRLDELGILAGTLPATGPGIRITIVDPQHKLGPEVLLDAVEEMRDAGAEAIEVDDRVRVVASSWFARQGDQLVVDGTPVAEPLVLDVIGDPHSLEEGARFRGGLVSQVQADGVGGTVLISRTNPTSITSLHATRTPQWARPA